MDVSKITFTEGDSSKPLVLLLHGLNGDIHDMVAPTWMVDAAGKEDTWHYDYRAGLQPDRDLGWSIYAYIGYYQFWDPSPKMEEARVRSWRQALQQHGYPTAAYSQVEPEGLLALAVRELAEAVDHLRRTYPRIVLLAHSRGGLLARRFLKENRTYRDLVGSIVGVITLHSPHLGSRPATIALEIQAKIEWLLAISSFLAPSDPLIMFLRRRYEEAKTPALMELAVGSPLLEDLRSGEEPLPGVTYATFGGTSVLVTRVRSWSHHWWCQVPQRWLPPNFRRVIYHHPNHFFPSLFPSLSSQALPTTPEFVQGAGDALVTDAEARLPFAASHQSNPLVLPHRSNSLNHAEALWDPGLQEQVLTVLTGITNSAGHSAAFVSQRVPDTMTAGQRYDVELVMRNTSRNTWTAGGPYPYRLGSQSPQDNVTWGLGRVDVPNEVRPDEVVPFRFTVTAPRAGTHHFQWCMLQEGIRWFGDLSPAVAVNVTTTELKLAVSASPSRIAIDRLTPLTVTCKDASTGATVAGRVWIDGVDSAATNRSFARVFDGSETVTVRATGYPEARVPVTFFHTGD